MGNVDVETRRFHAYGHSRLQCGFDVKIARGHSTCRILTSRLEREVSTREESSD